MGGEVFDDGSSGVCVERGDSGRDGVFCGGVFTGRGDLGGRGTGGGGGFAEEETPALE